ncbi:MAG: cupin domain-containing protein [Desulfonatronovibrionaceae bacterium]
MSKNADYWIKELGLAPHPEGGYFKRMFCSPESFGRPPAPRFDGDRPFYSAIYYLLRSGQFSAVHRLKNDEIWNYCSGNPVRIFSLDQNRGLCKQDIGPDPGAGQTFMLRVPARAWFWGLPLDGNADFSLVTCFVSPAFDYQDFELGGKKKLMSRFPEHADQLAKYCIRP